MPSSAKATFVVAIVVVVAMAVVNALKLGWAIIFVSWPKNNFLAIQATVLKKQSKKLTLKRIIYCCHSYFRKYKTYTYIAVICSTTPRVGQGAPAGHFLPTPTLSSQFSAT